MKFLAMIAALVCLPMFSYLSVKKGYFHECLIILAVLNLISIFSVFSMQKIKDWN